MIKEYLEIKEEIEDLAVRVKENNYGIALEEVSDWGGADVIISQEATLDLKRWEKETHFAIGGGTNGFSAHKLVITDYHKELSWLFKNLKEIYSGIIDYSNKYYFYGRLAQAAIDFDDPSDKNILNFVIDESLDILEDIKERGFFEED